MLCSVGSTANTSMHLDILAEHRAPNSEEYTAELFILI